MIPILKIYEKGPILSSERKECKNFVPKEGEENQKLLGGTPLNMTWDNNGFTKDMAMNRDGCQVRFHAFDTTQWD